MPLVGPDELIQMIDAPRKFDLDNPESMQQILTALFLVGAPLPSAINGASIDNLENEVLSISQLPQDTEGALT